MQQLTFSAPIRNSICTGMKHDTRRKLITRTKRGVKQNQHEVELILGEVREDVRTFQTVPWDIDAALLCIQSGGWFDYTADFISKEAKVFAMQAQSVWKELQDAS